MFTNKMRALAAAAMMAMALGAATGCDLLGSSASIAPANYGYSYYDPYSYYSSYSSYSSGPDINPAYYASPSASDWNDAYNGFWMDATYVGF